MNAILQATRWCPWCGEHMGRGGWMMMFWWLLILAGIVAVVWLLARRGGAAGRMFGPDRAEAILRERYARGEIDDETYRRQLAEVRRPTE
ncbi:MAG TPA: SHOCT domain-containing protein [Gemmatimonadaceae bacterium]|nr:SHOCT domain-containing protein [Gemmatimonadaceae bacterium]